MFVDQEFRDDLHEARKDREVDTVFVEEAIDLGERLLFGLGLEINMVKRHSVPLGVFRHLGMVGHNTCDVAMQLTASPALEHIDKTMARFGGQKRHTRLPCGGGHAHLHIQFLQQGIQSLLQVPLAPRPKVG